MNKKIALGQFYTPSLISSAMVAMALNLLRLPPRNAIELAAGNGDLIKPLKRVVPDCNITALDIDSENACILNESMDFNVYNRNSMESLDFLGGIKFDLALGNPPFLSKINVDDFIKRMVKENLNLDYELHVNIRAELIFVSQYISVLEKDGILGIILPDSLLCGKSFRPFRKSLMDMWEIEKIVEIQGSPFAFTEAKTHIIYIRKCKPKLDWVEILCIDQNGKGCKSIKISKKLLIDRMDYSFFKNNCKKTKYVRKLGDYAIISRGKKTHKELLNSGVSYLHSTHVSRYKINNQNNNSELYICRVGARVVGKSFLYSGESLEFSDCLYHLKFKDPKIKQDFYKHINSEEGLNQLRCMARGVCSKYLIIDDLKSFTF
ncbi:N-6 DNA methylase [Acinetobacter haemolyticus]|uniref:N-6 DNA methylase n=1 Tax=Acinetobacter haemolyticus TaxID=29430 RepID=UPI000D69D487|nr:N-6 DNA methylase [Acinetobacter haemolyticus]